MTDVANPLLQQVLYRRRMRRFARLSAASWLFFGGLHIAVWWAAFERNPSGHGYLGSVVWPLLLLATASFVVMVYFIARWLLAPGNPQEYDWLERIPSVPDQLDGEDEPTIIRARAPLAS